MPPKKRTKSGKAKSGRGKSRSKSKGGGVLKKRPPAPLLAAWLLAIILLVSLIYFARQSRRLPELSDLRTPPRAAKSPEAPPGAAREHAAPGRMEARESARVAEKPGVSPSGSDKRAEASRRWNPPPLASTSPAPPANRPEGARSPDLPRGLPKLSIVIDDFGPDIRIARQFAELPIPVTMSVLPFQPHSREIAQLAHREGKEVLLHLPMEPLSSKENPGPGALMVSMTDDQIRRNVTAALDTSPYFDGVNNHMGSRMTQDAHAMKIVLSELKERGLFFIDSMTVSGSKGWQVALELGVPTFKRNVFLDDDTSPAAIHSQIVKAVKIAQTRGMVLAIGHPHKTTLRSLQQAVPYFLEEGVDVVAARDLLKR